VCNLAKAKQTAAEIELQLSERRFILEAMNTAARVLEVPIVTAGVWFYLSRTNAALGALNKAILAAELAPIVGDIKFPEGVLIGAAMESSEDFLKILAKAGIVNLDDLKAAAEGATVDTGDFIADQLIQLVAPVGDCKTWTDSAFFNLERTKKKGSLDKFYGALNYAFAVKMLKHKNCERPSFVDEGVWSKK